MSANLDKALAFSRASHYRYLAELIDFVSIPSISTDASAKGDILRAANWVADALRRLGFARVNLLPTAGHPVVYGELLTAGADRPTILIYGHYDVQPVDPLDLWHTNPFEPEVRGENLYGRGASDMKGQVMVCLKAVEALIENGGLPVNLKFIVEGEEEIGSPNLVALIEAERDRLACDLCINPDSGMIGLNLPTITYGLRGLAYFELRVNGPVHDLHSGAFGGAIHNPAQVLCELIAGMHDAQGRITLPGFYDRVVPLSSEERTELARLPLGDQFYLDQCGAPALRGESGYTSTEQVSGRPTLEINGLLSGFTGPGTKTVLPAKSMAKISMRLVPDQDPADVHQQLVQYLEKHSPDTVSWEVEPMSGSPASITDRNSPAVMALSQALEATWGIRPVYKREGGSVPVVGHLKSILGVESVITGFGLPDDNLHAPNEKFHLPTYYLGIEAFIRFLDNLASVQAAG